MVPNFTDQELSLAFEFVLASSVKEQLISDTPIRQHLDLMLLNKLVRRHYVKEEHTVISHMLLSFLLESAECIALPAWYAVRTYVPSFIKGHDIFREYCYRLFVLNHSYDKTLQAMLPWQIAPVVTAHEIPLILSDVRNCTLIYEFLWHTYAFSAVIAAERGAVPVDTTGRESASWVHICTASRMALLGATDVPAGICTEEIFQEALDSLIFAWCQHIRFVEQTLWFLSSISNLGIGAPSEVSAAYSTVFASYRHKMIHQGLNSSN